MQSLKSHPLQARRQPGCSVCLEPGMNSYTYTSTQAQIWPPFFFTNGIQTNTAVCTLLFSFNTSQKPLHVGNQSSCLMLPGVRNDPSTRGPAMGIEMASMASSHVLCTSGCRVLVHTSVYLDKGVYRITS